MTKPRCLRCRCHINMSYGKTVRYGIGTLKGLKPCPVHEPELYEQYLADVAEADAAIADHETFEQARADALYDAECERRMGL